MIWLVVMGSVGVAFLIAILSLLGERFQKDLVEVLDEREARLDTFALAQEELRERLNREPTVAEVYDFVWALEEEEDDAIGEDEASADVGVFTEVVFDDTDTVVGHEQLARTSSPNGVKGDPEIADPPNGRVQAELEIVDLSAGGADGPLGDAADRLHLRIKVLDEMLDTLRSGSSSAEATGSG